MRKAAFIFLLLLFACTSQMWQIEKTTTTTRVFPNERITTTSIDTFIYSGTRHEVLSYCKNNSKRVNGHNGNIFEINAYIYRIIE